MQHDKHISIIIPTHNRPESLSTLLRCLAEQTYPMHLMEVIVVADGCTEETVALLQEYQAPYSLKYIEQAGKGPAVARNRGAEIAIGQQLLFLDDDIVPSAGLVAAHVKASDTSNTVVIGYLPYHSPTFSGFYIAQLRAWWETEFHNMRRKGYRYTYRNLLSGNFSLSAELYGGLSGFNETLRCREDYELGARLIRTGAQFVFSDEAWGKHCDAATDLERSFHRKEQEGYADVQLGRLHPDLIGTLPITSYLSDTGILFWIYKYPVLGRLRAVILHRVLNLLEWGRLRDRWQKKVLELHRYWYLKGVATHLPTAKQLHQYLQKDVSSDSTEPELEINLKMGMQYVEALVDRERPVSVRIFYGSQVVGSIPKQAGAERLRGVHLLEELATTLAWPLAKAMTLEEATTNLNSTTSVLKEINYGN